MFRENRRPLLAFALVATVCAATLVQGVRSEAIQGFVAAQVPQVVVAGAQLVPMGEADVAPAAVLHGELPDAKSPGVPATAPAEWPRVSSAPAQGDEEAAPAHPHARPPANAHGHGRPDHAGRQRSHRGAPSPRAALPPGHHREAGRADRRTDRPRPDRARTPGASQGRPPGRGNSRAEETG